MLTLAINTASFNESVALFDLEHVLAETSWHGAYDESEVLLPHIDELLKKAGAQQKDIERVLVVTGPGPFSAVRIGVTVAQTLAYTLQRPVYGIGSVALWQARLPPAIKKKNWILLLPAGGNFFYRMAGDSLGIPKGIFPAAELFIGIPESTVHFLGDWNEDIQKEFSAKKVAAWKQLKGEELLSFGVAAQLLSSTQLEAAPLEPHYWKPPTITKGNNPLASLRP